MAKRTVEEYMSRRCWATDSTLERKRYLAKQARRCRQDPDIASKIGGMLIYNQVIEQFLSDIVEMSVYYIKAQIWPVEVELDVEADKATFGKIIDCFRQYATQEPNRDRILTLLQKFNTKRNQVVHDLFDIKDLTQLGKELDQYSQMADELIRLLDDYDDEVKRRLDAAASGFPGKN